MEAGAPGRSAWRWRNLPLPEAHLVGLGAGLIIDAVTHWRLGWPVIARQGIGWPLIVAGLAVVAWAVLAAGAVDLERPEVLVRSGPFARSRNPMYVGWTLFYLGVTLVLGALSPMVFLLAVLVRTCFDVLKEERSLAERFGPEYDAYRASVRRWL